jgi:multisubunit Na+/H+ antiporter MnhB subunit
MEEKWIIKFLKNRKETRFQKWFLNIMNNKGGAQICVLTGILSICLFLVPFFIQSYNIITSDENIASKCLVMFGVLCVVISLVFLVFFLVKVGKFFFNQK